MPSREVLEEVAAWIAKAESDFKNIELVLPADDAPFDTVCFHAQQAAEKYLKALLTFYGIPFRKTHDLPELVLLLPSRSSVPGEVGDLTDLTYAAADARYPNAAVQYDRTMAEGAVRTAELVKFSVLEELSSAGYIKPA
jgi:HEPN domain-containing protein